MAYQYTARLRIRPGTESTFRTLIDEMVAAEHANPDCLGYEVFHLEDPLDYVFLETYTDLAADPAHKNSPVTKPLIERMVACIDGGFAVEEWFRVASMND
ncbi:MAG TPA: antibiotic biosynthesis monooxygenase [Croceicoccus sp.]|nr:antibiotic biosynthesis monooxygenase [Croceicoccus sp.]